MRWLYLSEFRAFFKFELGGLFFFMGCISSIRWKTMTSSLLLGVVDLLVTNFKSLVVSGLRCFFLRSWMTSLVVQAISASIYFLLSIVAISLLVK